MRKRIVLGAAIVIVCMLLAPQAIATQEAQDAQTQTLIRGLDGGYYEAYQPAVIEKVQNALKDNGLYEGEVNGRLDEATMKAIGEFQKANNLTVSGVPSPATRKVLLGE